MNHLKVKDNPDWIRDPKTKALININQDSLKEYKNRLFLHNRVQELSREFTELKESVNDIKQLILSLHNTK